MTTHRIGYARVSSRDQNLDLQLNALKKAGCDRIYEDRSAAPSPDAPVSTRRWVLCGTGTLWWCGSWTVWAGA